MSHGAADSLPPWFQPTTQVAAGMLFIDEHDRVLLVKPTYGSAWNLPGGVVEAGESPSAAATREVSEEIGLDVAPGTFMCVDYRPPVPGGRGDALRFLFRGGRLTQQQLDSIKLAPGEISDWRLVEVDRLGDYLIPLIAKRLRLALSGHTYLEAGHPVPQSE